MEITEHEITLNTNHSTREHYDLQRPAGLGLVKDLTMALVRELNSLQRSPQKTISEGIDLNEEVRRFEVDLIKSALNRTGGHQTRAARLLGIKLTTLNDKIKRYNIDPHESAMAEIRVN